MGIENLKSVKDCLVNQVQAQMAHLECVDTKELGEVIDMVKDLEEAMYYCSIVEAMENPSYQENSFSDIMYYTERPMEIKIGSDKEGRSPKYRKMYMESKELHHGTSKQLNDLENYLKELSSDITEMIRDASSEEKQLLHRKISDLATKIEQS